MKINLDSEKSLELVEIPGGSFLMGSVHDPTEQPIHEVTLPSFWMGKFQVTQEQWVEVMCENPSWYIGITRPVDQVTWRQAKEFCERVSKNTGYKVRLPTESEWEYAARGGTTTDYSFGDDWKNLVDYAWFGVNSEGQTHLVGQKKPNPFGLYDMHGNVWEWVEDNWHDDYDGAPTDGSAWIVGGEIANKVLRGGSWFDSDGNFTKELRSANRYPFYLRNSSSIIGFRVVVTDLT